MIEKFVTRFDAARAALREQYAKTRPGSYDDIVADVVRLLADEDDYDSPDPDRVTTIDHGDYQGTRLFIVGAKGYQPSTYWSIFVNYGSCSGCDTFESIRGYSDDGEPVPESEVEGYMTLALHMVQSMKQLGGES